MDVSGQRQQYASNVKKVFGVYFLSIAVRDISFGTLFDAYLMDLGGTRGNILVGTVESVRGLLQMLLSYPLGYLADRMPRVRLCRYNIPFFSLGFVLLMSGILLDDKKFIYAGMAIWAPCMQCWFSASSAIVADSCPPETRTTTIAYMSNVQLLASSSGPLLQIVCLFVLGQDQWSMPLLHRAMGLGCLIWPLVVVGTCMFAELPPMEKTAAKGRSRFLTSDLNQPLLNIPIRWWVAISLQVATTITSIGAGMTVKFFPLFFRMEYGFEPRDLCLLSFTYPLALACMQQICLRVSQRLGRLQACIIFHFLGTASLFVICVAKPLYVVLPMYYVRGALMNAKQPILQAITMDLISSNMRGRWSSIQSIAGFSWSGSAFIGGMVAQSHGYRASFAVTAGVYLFAGLLHFPLLLIFPNERESAVFNKKVTPASTPRLYASPVSQCGVLADAQLPLLEESLDMVFEGDEDAAAE